ncbi:MAG: PAS domain S-box protein [Ktedonobacteraceae bacterium]|nr:PAS domain S-box protein [Ktedonobacteraceae bacterium]
MGEDKENRSEPGIIVSSMPGSERHAIEQLRESEERYRVLFEQAPVGMAHVAVDGRWLQVNQKLCDIVGYTRKDLLERTFQDITYPDDLAPTLECVRSLLQNELQTCTLETRYLRKDGAVMWIKLTVSPVRDARGNPHYFISIIEDISERKRAKAEVQRQEVALRAANLRMEEFLSVASHELRTPLTTIKANIQLAMRRLKPLSAKTNLDAAEINDKISATQDMLTRAERQVGVLNRLVGDMIDISRIQAGKLQIRLRQEPYNLTSIVQEIIQEQRNAAPGRSILIEVPAGEEFPVQVDPERIGQVLANYVSNALKYSEAALPVTVRLQREESYVRVSVQDEGSGLSAEEQERIWECFYRSPDAKVVSGSGVGLGLGLYISQTIIARHSGQVGVQSVRDKGSTFWFTLPIAQQNVGG